MLYELRFLHCLSIQSNLSRVMIKTCFITYATSKALSANPHNLIGALTFASGFYAVQAFRRENIDGALNIEQTNRPRLSYICRRTPNTGFLATRLKLKIMQNRNKKQRKNPDIYTFQQYKYYRIL